MCRVIFGVLEGKEVQDGGRGGGFSTGFRGTVEVSTSKPWLGPPTKRCVCVCVMGDVVRTVYDASWGLKKVATRKPVNLPGCFKNGAVNEQRRPESGF